MIDHLTLRVRSYAKSKAFYAAALKPLGYEFLMEFGGNMGGMGIKPKPDFWLAEDETGNARPQTHIAFVAADRAQVDAFHAAALAAGGTDFGKPGTRAEYHPNYYGAFVLDPDGHNIEAVCHLPA